MIRQIRGKVAETGLNYAVVDIGGVGYLVFTNATLLNLGDSVIFYTYLAVRENALDLYGFLKKEELDVFELLIDLPKIGPKTALQILSQADVSLILEASQRDDAAYLSKLSGIGKKSAEKIVAGLKDKLGEKYAFTNNPTIPKGEIYLADTIDALITLGYPQQEARRVVLEITTTNPELKNSAAVIKLALKLLNR